MFRILMLSLVTSTALLSINATAVVPDENSAVSVNWKKIGREMRSMARISDAAELSALMDQFHAAATANLTEIPSFMEEGSQQHIDYVKGVENFIAKVEEAKALADAGDLDGAKAITATFRDIRTKSHDYFELE